MKTALIYASLLVGAVSVTASPVLGAPPAGKGKPPTEEEAGNNLSVPGKFVGTGGPALRLPCLSVPSVPMGSRCIYYPDYWCQKTDATWQAACTTAIADKTTKVTADWGDNLTGDGRLKAGKPIRVEVNLTDNLSGSQPGYIVTKLNPEVEDRLATYGTRGDPYDTLNAPFSVFDSGAKLTIESCSNTACETPKHLLTVNPMTAEINSTGNIVFGYNWGTGGRRTAPATGIYKLTFFANGTQITSVQEAPKAQLCAVEFNCTYVIISVGTAGGGKPIR